MLRQLYSGVPISTWTCVQVKDWLNMKGLNLKIQNKFDNEGIDGEALSYLREGDVHALTANIDITYGERLKLWKYIEFIQQSNNPFLSPTRNQFLTLPSVPSSPHHNANANTIPFTSTSPTNTNDNYNESASLTTNEQSLYPSVSAQDIHPFIGDLCVTNNNIGPCILPSHPNPNANNNECINDDINLAIIKNESIFETDNKNNIIIKEESPGSVSVNKINKKRRRVICDESSDEDIEAHPHNEDHRPLKKRKYNNKNGIMSLQEEQSGLYAIRSISKPSIQGITATNIDAETETDTDTHKYVHKRRKYVHKRRKKPEISTAILKSTGNINTNNRETKPKTVHKSNTNKHNKNEKWWETNETPSSDDDGDGNNRHTHYRYSNNNTHETSMKGKPWRASALSIIWNLHYDKGWSNLQIAEKFRRTECGIMVQLDKIYKDKRANKELVNKKFRYQKRLKQLKNERRWSEKDGKWKTVKNSADNGDYANVHTDSEDEYDYDECTSSEDDDEPIGLRMAREKKKHIACVEDQFCIGNEAKLSMDRNMIIKREGVNCVSAFLKNIVFGGRHCWKFRFRSDVSGGGSGSLHVGLWRCDRAEIETCDLMNYIGKYAGKCYVYDGYASRKNIYGEVADKWSDENSYGIQIKDGDVVGMYVDFNALTLAFSVNGIDFGVSHSIKCGEYRAAVSISAENTKIELLSYTKHDGNSDEDEDDDKPILSSVI